jgi:cell division protein FtsB
MSNRRIKFKIAMAIVSLLATLGFAGRLLAQSADDSDAMLKLYVDPKTHIVYTVPGRGRRLLTEVPASALSTRGLEERQEETERKLDQDRARVAELAARNQQLEASNFDLSKQVSEIRPAWRDYIENFQDKFRLGTLVYGDYRFYTHTGFQPQELTQINNPGPWNNNYNSFDITRTYLNFYFFPTKDWTIRLTPNMYKTIGSSNDKIGQNTGFGSNLDGNLALRMKYANLQYTALWDKLHVPALKGGTVIIGETANPLVGWEEDLYGYRYVNLTPWNYLSLSSTQLGIHMEGPIKPFSDGLTYVDYGLGVYDNSSFHAFEQTDTKQVMARVSLYPFGSDWRFLGLGLTGFYNYGYGNTTPDTASIPTVLKGPDAHITRIAALMHYTAEQWGLAGEFDYGNNAFSAGNLFSGSGPADEFGTATGKAVAAGKQSGNSCTPAAPCSNPNSGFSSQTAAWNAILNNGQAREIGWDVFGHYHIPDTRLTAFGMFQWFLPNDKVTTDPLDFQRFIVGASYQYNEFLRFALDSQNMLFYHSQRSMSVSQLKEFNYVPGSKLNGLTLPTTGSIPNLVPFDTHSIFLNVEFNY